MTAVESPRNSVRRTLILAGAAVAVALSITGYLYLRRAPILTDKDTIVLADFTNKTGDPVFDETLRQGLAVQLEQSPFLSLICDTGALIDHLVESAPDHRLFRSAIDQARTRYVPGLVLAEVDYFFRDERQAMQVFIQDLARGAFTYAPPTIGQLSRAMEVDRRFADLSLGLVDSSVVALAESLGIRRLATRDVRHFAAVRLRDGRAFELVVLPTDPDKS